MYKISVDLDRCTVQSLYNIPSYNPDLVSHLHLLGKGPGSYLNVIGTVGLVMTGKNTVTLWLPFFTRNYRKTTMEWSFSYNLSNCPCPVIT